MSHQTDTIQHFARQVQLYIRTTACRITRKRAILEYQTLEERSRPDMPAFLRLQA